MTKSFNYILIHIKEILSHALSFDLNRNTTQI